MLAHGWPSSSAAAATTSQNTAGPRRATAYGRYPTRHRITRAPHVRTAARPPVTTAAAKAARRGPWLQNGPTVSAHAASTRPCEASARGTQTAQVIANTSSK